MRLTALGVLAAAAMLTLACGGKSETTSPTAPTPTNPSTPSAPPQGCSTPQEPQNLAASSIDTRVTITWSAVPGAVEYNILIGSRPGTADLINTNTTQPAYQWGGRVGTFYARVAAKNACGLTSPSRTEIAFTVTSPN